VYSLGANNQAELVDQIHIDVDWPRGITFIGDGLYVAERNYSLIYHYEAFEPALVVAVDIKPTSCPNPLNLKSKGVLPVAILGSEELDVNTIDTASIRLAGIAPIRSSYEDAAAPVLDANDCNCTTVGSDGYTDLTLKFKTQEIVEAIGEVGHGDVLTLELTGVLFGERPIEGADCIVIRGKFKPVNRADMNRDGVVNFADYAIFADEWLW